MKKNLRTRLMLVLFASIGLAFIFISSFYMGPIEVDIAELDESMIGEPVKLEGEVLEESSQEFNIFMEVGDETGTIEVVKFDTEKIVRSNDKIEVEGELSMHEGSLSIIADEIEIKED